MITALDTNFVSLSTESSVSKTREEDSVFCDSVTFYVPWKCINKLHKKQLMNTFVS